MKRTGGLFLVAMLAGAMTLGTYKLFFEDSISGPALQQESMPVFQTSNLGPGTAGIDDADFTLAAEKTVNAVVHVKNITLNRGPSNIFEFFYGYGDQARPQVGTGSGVIISPDGYIVTNNHVIAKANQLMVTLNDNKTGGRMGTGRRKSF